MEIGDSHHFRWVVVGGGPCGIIAVALLVEHLQQEKDADKGDRAVYDKIAWVDPYFRVGSLPRWREVQANSSVQAICSSFAAIPSLRFRAMQQSRIARGLRTLIGLLPEQVEDDMTTRKTWCELGLVVDALEDATATLLSEACVIGIHGQVESLIHVQDDQQRHWQVQFAAFDKHEQHAKNLKDEQERHRGILASLRCEEMESNVRDDVLFPTKSSPLFARCVVLATGAVPKSPPESFQKNLQIIDLETALISANLRSLLRWTPPPSCLGCSSDATWQELRWTVVGSSHSAMLAIRNLIGLGVRKVQVVHRRSLFYVERRNELGLSGKTWLKNIGTGLLGTTGSWCRKELPLLEQSGRVVWQRFVNSDSGDLDLESWVCRNSDVVVFATGFSPNQLPCIYRKFTDLASCSDLGTKGGEPLHSSVDDLLKNAPAGRSRSRSPKMRYQHRQDCDKKSPGVWGSLQGCPNVVGLGIGFPEHHVEPDGDVDIRVGFVRHYMEYAARILGVGIDRLHFSDTA